MSLKSMFLFCFLLFLFGCVGTASDVENYGQKSNKNTVVNKTVNNYVGEKVTPFEKEKPDFELKKRIKVNEVDSIIINGLTLKKGDKVNNVITGQRGVATGDIVVTLKDSQATSKLSGFVLIESESPATARYKALSDEVDLLPALNSLRHMWGVNNVELQIFYTADMGEPEDS